MLDAGHEYRKRKRNIRSLEGCSCVFGGMAAALAAGYCALDGRMDDAKREKNTSAIRKIYSSLQMLQKVMPYITTAMHRDSTVQAISMTNFSIPQTGSTRQQVTRLILTRQHLTSRTLTRNSAQMNSNIHGVSAGTILCRAVCFSMPRIQMTAHI